MFCTHVTAMHQGRTGQNPTNLDLISNARELTAYFFRLPAAGYALANHLKKLQIKLTKYSQFQMFLQGLFIFYDA